MPMMGGDGDAGGDGVAVGHGIGDGDVADLGDARGATKPPPPPFNLVVRVDRIEQMQQTLLSGIQWIIQVEVQRAAVGGYDVPPLSFTVPPPPQQQDPVDHADDMED
ncbi:hypothetical protein L1987_48852 [Smallanthus sonchifolius]|uniref:Uncharacterized protein n=1 Tax=Smallanthus sonchifolius TaxID=185202 RepID=A0ACB9FSX0_9ASTR|nr:hypothetical protein L1987_48852 [Smallanthus sonchifolius]